MTAKGKPYNSLSLSHCWLYAIASKADLARRLSTENHKVSVEDVERLAQDIGNYKLFTLKQDGKERPVQEPKREVQRLHSRIHKLLMRVETPEYLHSTVRGKSYLTNARAHAATAPLIKIDVKKFFASVPRRAIFRFFLQTMKCRRDVAGLLADLLSFEAHLPTGSSASPIIAYYAFKPMFDALDELARQSGLKMSCYVDDITMSGAAAANSVLFKAHQIISKFGLRSHKMRRFSGCSPKTITGVNISPVGERVPNKLHLKIKMGFEALKSASPTKDNAKNLNSLLGRLEAARQIDPVFGERAKTLRAQTRISQFQPSHC